MASGKATQQNMSNKNESTRQDKGNGTGNSSGNAVFDRTLNWARTTGLRHWAEETTGSTNAVAKNDDNPKTIPQPSPSPDLSGAPALYLTRHQTDGRGRGSNTWISTNGTLLSSWSFQMSRHPQPILAPLVGLALFEAAREAWSVSSPFNLKAPNDLYLGQRKAAGLLIEIVGTFSQMRTVVGLGMNISAAPSDVPTATCVADHSAEAMAEGRLETFLNMWQKKLSEAIVAGSRPTLSPEARERLLYALNQHPLLSEPILRVDEYAQLYTSTRVIHWHEL